jgi:hypothetical protein
VRAKEEGSRERKEKLKQDERTGKYSEMHY